MKESGSCMDKIIRVFVSTVHTGLSIISMITSTKTTPMFDTAAHTVKMTIMLSSRSCRVNIQSIICEMVSFFNCKQVN